MAREKNERLVNLVIALLATKKYLTKGQIFKAVNGYEGNPEARDRMFERDKEELRTLGIEIEMQSVDPLFEDEIGYRIRPDRYRFNLGELTPEEISMLSLAAEAWRSTAFNENARTTSLRLQSLGVATDFSEISNAPTITNVPENFSLLLELIEQRRILQIKYRGSNDLLQTKEIAPHGIYSINQRWYLYAVDQGINEFRSYRLDRIEESIKRTQKVFVPSEFTLPSEHFPSVDVVLDVRRDSAIEILSKSEIVEDKDEWLRIKSSFRSLDEAVDKILFYAPNIVVIEPRELINRVISKLEELIRIHD